MLKIIFLTIVAVLEGIMIAALVSHPNHLVVTVERKAATMGDPFYWALEYEAPDSEFEKLVKRYPEWIDYRQPATGWSALPECIALKRTNVARILIANGASVGEVVKSNTHLNRETVELLYEIEKDLTNRIVKGSK